MLGLPPGQRGASCPPPDTAHTWRQRGLWCVQARHLFLLAGTARPCADLTSNQRRGQQLQARRSYPPTTRQAGAQQRYDGGELSPLGGASLSSLA